MPPAPSPTDLPPKERPPEAAPSFAQVFQEHAPFVWRVLRRLGVGAADVEDVCQEVFLVVHRRLGEFEGRSSLRTWIYGISARVASEHLRRPYHRHEALADSPPERSAPASQLQELEQRRAVAQLDRALGELDEDKRVVFVFYEIEQLPMNEIAAMVGCPLQTAYSRLHAARRHIEAAMRLAREDRCAP